jgi:hypothetical protein
MIYDIKLEKRKLKEDTPFYKELKMMDDLSLFHFVPDETKNFNENMNRFFRQKEILNAVSKIYDIKVELYKLTGEVI